jgi:DNA polymerase-3 subunit epsilon
VVTDEELEQLCRVAALLDLDVEDVRRRTDPFRSADGAIELAPGLSACFTGQGRDAMATSSREQNKRASPKAAA